MPKVEQAWSTKLIDSDGGMQESSTGSSSSSLDLNNFLLQVGQIDFPGARLTPVNLSLDKCDKFISFNPFLTGFK